eukprot:SAG22_NODE_5003_length_1110_cov_1.781405_2_plen_186_part_01
MRFHCHRLKKRLAAAGEPGALRGRAALAAAGKAGQAGRGRKAGEVLVSLQWSGQPERRAALKHEFEADFAKGGGGGGAAAAAEAGKTKGGKPPSEKQLRAAEMEARLRSMWAGVDVDNSGSLDHDELRRVLQQIHGEEMTDKQFEKAVKQMGRDKVRTEALPLPCVSTVFLSKTMPFRAVRLQQQV